MNWLFPCGSPLSKNTWMGRLRVGTKTEIGPGGYHLAHSGALHATIGTATGATIFLRGAIPEAGHLLE